MVVENIHVMDANETTSEAFKNYAGAAFLVGMAVLSIGIGAGIIAESVRKLRKSNGAPNLTEELLRKMRGAAGRPSEKGPVETAVEDSVEELRRAMGDILGSKGLVLDQVTSKFPTLYYLKKSYKEDVVVGSVIPENYLVVKPETMTMDVFMQMDNIKFKSKTTTHIKGGVNLVTVDEILNSEPVKPV